MELKLQIKYTSVTGCSRIQFMYSLFILVMTTLWSSADGGKVLIFFTPGSGSMSEQMAIAEGLLGFNHEVYALVSQDFLGHPMLEKLKEGVHIYYHREKPGTTYDLEKYGEELINYFIEEGKSQADMFYDIHIKWARKMCWWSAHDNDTWNDLRQEKFDIAVFETFVLCHHMVAYKLNIPYVSASTFHSTVVARSHPLITEFTYTIEGENNNFLNRLKLFIHMYLADYAVRFWMKNEDLGSIDNEPYPPLDELVLKAELYLNNQNGVISFPTMSMPNVIKVGGLIAQPPKMLTGNLAEIMNCTRANTYGVIVVSFGSIFASLPDKLLIPMLIAFSHVKQLVVWRLKFRSGQAMRVQVPPNVKLFDWLPQNDVLGHPNTKLFVTHGGAVGLAEAIYNGVPMLGIGIHGDQPLNTQRMQQKGYGINFNPLTLNAKSFLKSIRTIFHNYDSYRRVTNKASAIMKHLPDPRKEAAFWIDHVMQFGSDHLKTVASKMPQYQLLMLDIFAFFAVLTIFAAFLLILILRFCLSKLYALYNKWFIKIDRQTLIDPSVEVWYMKMK